MDEFDDKRCVFCTFTAEHPFQLNRHYSLYPNGECLKATTKEARQFISKPVVSDHQASTCHQQQQTDYQPAEQEASPEDDVLHPDEQCFRFFTLANNGRGLPQKDIAEFFQLFQLLQKKSTSYTDLPGYLAWCNKRAVDLAAKGGYCSHTIEVTKADVPGLPSTVSGTFFCYDLLDWLKNVFINEDKFESLVLYPVVRTDDAGNR